MNDVFGLDRGSVRCSIDLNERDLRNIAEHRDAFCQFVTARGTAVTDFAKKLGVKSENVQRFHSAIEEALGELFYAVTEELEADVDRDKRLIGECEDSLDYIGARR